MPAARGALLRRGAGRAAAQGAGASTARRAATVRAAVADPADAAAATADADPLAAYVQTHGGKRAIRKARAAALRADSDPAPSPARFLAWGASSARIARPRRTPPRAAAARR